MSGERKWTRGDMVFSVKLGGASHYFVQFEVRYVDALIEYNINTVEDIHKEDIHTVRL